ncbi:CRE-LGE-1 protein [Caenorhabditis remanei]|uniref:CRE-LGE-1 protein n=1 Tax=Caenorhabditis remanei TaxID=31234 RepID=E3M2I0_CAERE|nr:CRE-LGE-1 protein [Caenorhabditis remanei]
MMDLDRLREGDWKSKWRAVANKYLKLHGKTTMSDQDIFNAYIHDYPTEIKSLPCEYNFQLGTLTKSDELCVETPLALHFNSQNKTVRRNYVVYNAVRKEIEGIDGSDLRRRRRSLKKRALPSVSKTDSKTSCEEYMPLQNFRTLPNALGRLMETAKLCLVTQFSKDRLDSFIENAKHWKQPISAAIYGTDQDMNEIVEAVKTLNRPDLVLHMVFKEPTDQTMSQDIYPINYLRNTAIKYSNCEKILMTDVDFMIYEDTQDLVVQSKDLKDKEVLVIPAFETAENNITDVTTFPHTKEQLVKAFFKKKINVFRGITWPSAHNSTNVAEWIIAEDVYSVNYEKNYEPYFIIKKSSCPMYDQRFGGFGWNKVTHVLQLRMMNYTFKVSPTSFMIHQNHNISNSLFRWRHDSHYQKCLHYLKKQFVLETADELGLELK